MSAILQLIEGILGHLAGDWLFITKKDKDGKTTEKVLNPAAVEQIRQIRLSRKRKSRVDEGVVEAAVNKLEKKDRIAWRLWRQNCLSEDQRADLSYSYAIMFSTITNFSDGNTEKALDALKESMLSLLAMEEPKRTKEAVAMGFAFSPDGYKTIWDKAKESSAGQKIQEAGEQTKQVLNEAQTGLDSWQKTIDEAKKNAATDLQKKLQQWKDKK